MTSQIIFRMCQLNRQLLMDHGAHRIKFIAHNHPPFNVCNQKRFAGHAKWQNIAKTKASGDLAKGRMISRYVLLVRRAVLAGNRQGDPKLNGKLADVLSEAYKMNVPKATLERAINRALNVKIISLNLEIQGPGGCAIIARCETDDVGALRREVKKILRKSENSNLMPDDTLINMFKSRGFIRTTTKTIDGRDIDGDFAEEAAILANAEEVRLENFEDAQDESLSKMWIFSTDANCLNPCRGELEKQGFKVLSHDLDLVPYRSIKFGPDIYSQVETVINALNDLEQVIEVFHNVSPPDAE